MQMHEKKDTKLRLCTSCFNCKQKNGKIYCKLGVWEEKANGRTILHTPFDFNCNRYEEV